MLLLGGIVGVERQRVRTGGRKMGEAGGRGGQVSKTKAGVAQAVSTASAVGPSPLRCPAGIPDSACPAGPSRSLAPALLAASPSRQH